MDPDVPRGAPAAPTVDHVVPRAVGGGGEPSNLRLAHRRCNGRRGSRLPELEWPRDLPVLDAAPVWSVVQRALRRPGEWEVVAALADRPTADQARQWLAGALGAVLGGAWELRVTDTGSRVATLALRLAGAPDRRPAPRRPRRGRRRRLP